MEFAFDTAVPVLSRTPRVLRELLQGLPVVHDLDHLVQITRVMGKLYTDAVGPWRQYLRILGPA